IHNFAIQPTPDTFSFYVVFMCHHIRPKSVDSYLSGICSKLEPFFPDVRTVRRSSLVSRTLDGCKKLKAIATVRKLPLTRAQLRSSRYHYHLSSSHDNKLFLAILFTAFNGLLRIGELVWPDRQYLQDWRKVIMRHSVMTYTRGYEFLLPAHKADRFFEGNKVMIESRQGDDDPLSLFLAYLTSRDSSFPLLPALWLRSDGSVPTRRWFISHLHCHFGPQFSGHSLRSGGATALAAEGVPPDLIQ
ncbi:hypothetical protein PUNSTDRAFT_30536, partial [Punctularia strigosozonata HHB-11173 SS5]|uniref:uncharacterized protein n=1 Tax=Punctularia strigosozonata (strain HHB-11173) TaxID=741275 RepID=UPI0004416999